MVILTETQVLMIWCKIFKYSISGSQNSTLTFANTVVASFNPGKIKFVNSAGTDVLVIDGNVLDLLLPDLTSSADAYKIEALSFTAKNSAITGTLADGTLWYDSPHKH